MTAFALLFEPIETCCRTNRPLCLHECLHVLLSLNLFLKCFIFFSFSRCKKIFAKYFLRLERFKRSIATETSDVGRAIGKSHLKNISSSVNEKSASKFKLISQLFTTFFLLSAKLCVYIALSKSSLRPTDHAESQTMNEINRI